METNTLQSDIHQFIMQKNYPCIAAIKSVQKEEYIVRTYEAFGQALFWRELRQDLQFFLAEQKRTGSTYLTFWAIFEGQSKFSEDDFESGLWNELSHLSSFEKLEQDWADPELAQPENPGFCLSIDGQAFFVVGLHPQSSREARRFAKPALVFNSIEQFKKLEREGKYEPLKAVIRQREIALQGSVNPMVLKHGDQWESIQFSGKNNTEKWKCPFHFFKDNDKKPENQTLS